MHIRKYRRLPLNLALFFLLAAVAFSCASSQQKTDSNKFFEEWKARVEDSQGYSPPRKKYSREGLDPSRPDQEPEPLRPQEKPLPTRKVTMKMSDIEVAVLLRALARVADQNIMLNEKVTGKVNINITDAPWDQTFLGLLRTQGLTYTWEGDIIRILTIQDMENELKREVQKNELAKIEPYVTRVIKVNYTEAAKLRDNLEKFVSSGKEGQPLGSVLVDEHTNSLIVQAIPGDVRRIIDVVEVLDRPTSQILIEAQIVETTNDTARALGVQWGGLLYGSSNGKNYWMGPGGDFPPDTSLFDETLNDVVFLPEAGQVSNFPVTLPDEIGLSLGFLFQNIGNSVLSAQLQALQEEGLLNILSSPSITTLENQISLIESGDRIPIQTVENGEVSIQYIQAVLKLEVTPNVIDDETLKLKIVVNKDEPDFSRTVGGNPTIITRKAETNVILFNGQTTVIGGLSEEKSSTGSQGIPYLKDVPGLGWLFGNKSKASEMDELLIFITPYILEERPLEQVSSKIDKQPAAAETQP
jgi:type IV pilus assembly protein PilQ